jgi:rhamnogalacturonan endolyase
MPAEKKPLGNGRREDVPNAPRTKVRGTKQQGPTAWMALGGVLVLASSGCYATEPQRIDIGNGGVPIATGGQGGGAGVIGTSSTGSGGTGNNIVASGGAGAALSEGGSGAVGASQGKGGAAGMGGGWDSGIDSAAAGTFAGAGTSGPASGGAGGKGGGLANGGATGTAGATGGGTHPNPAGHFQMEDLDRGVVAVKVSGGVYVGWRMFGYEYDGAKPESVSYNVYRGTSKIANVTDSTNYLDASGTPSSTYAVSPVIGGSEGAQSPQIKVWGENYLRIPLSPPGAAYEANDGSPGDLDGDGQYEIVLKWQPSNAKDNSQSGTTDDTYLDGLRLDGTRMWRIDLGANIRSGAHYTQPVVYDFDGDGKAEIAVKTAPGTKDGKGNYLHTGPAANDDDSKVYRNSDGYVLSGPEYLTVFSGQTGEELATIDYPVPRGTVSSWGDDYGNRVDRFNGGFAFVSDSGKTASGRPSIITQRGYYTRLTMTALTWRDGKLAKVWGFDSNASGNSKAAGQGDHSAMAADTDGDGAQEIITGSTTIGSDGTLRCTTGDGHGDALHVGELVVGKGISVFTVHEGTGGYDVHNGNTCAFYVNVTGGDDNGRGVADDISPGNPGAEMWSSTASGLQSCADGKSVSSSKPSSTNFLIYWDADESRELLDGAKIAKYGGSTLLSADNCEGNNGTKNTPTLTADLLGDWREELVVRESDSSGLRIYTTTDVTKRRIYTLMHDPTYRAQVSFEQSSYNQPPHTGFHIGSGMADPPKPDIYVK